MNKIFEWLRNLKISQKELLLMAVSSLFLILIGLIGLHFILQAGNIISHMYEKHLLSMQYLNNIRIQTSTNQANLYKFIFVQNPSERQRIYSDINRRIAIWHKDLDKYQDTYLDSYEQRILKPVPDEINEIDNARNNAIQLALAGQNQQAYSYYQKYLAVLNDFSSRLDTLAEYNRLEAENRFKEYEQVVRLAKVLVPLFILLALLSSLALSLLISRFITDPVISLRDKISQVAAGNLNVSSALTKSKDEIGELDVSFNSMTQNIRDLIESERAGKEREEFLRKTIISSIRSFSIEDITRIIVTQTGQLYEANRCFLIGYDAKKQQYLPIQAYGTYIANINVRDISGFQISNKILEPFSKILFGQKQPLAISDIEHTDLPEATRQFFRDYDIKSIAIAPLFYVDLPLGLLVVDFNSSSKEFRTDQIELLSTIANQFAIAMRQTQLFNEVQNARDRQELLRRIIDTIRSTLDFNDIKKRIVTEVGETFNADRCFIRIYDPNTDKFLPVDEFSEYLSSSAVPSIVGATFEETIYGEFKDRYKKKRNHIMPDLRSCLNDPNADISGIKGLIDEYGVKSNYGFPMFFDDSFLGVFVLHYTKEVVRLSDEQIQFLTAVADQASISIRQSRLFSSTRQLADREALLRRVIETIRSTLDINEVFSIICEEVANVFKAERAVVVMFPIKGSYLNYVVKKEYLVSKDIKGFSEGFDPRVGIFWGENVVAKGITIAIDDIAASDAPDYFRNNYLNMGIKSIINVPIQKGEDKWGTFGLSMSKVKHWSDDEIKLLETIGTQIYTAIKQAELYSLTKKQAERSELIRTIIEAIGTNLELNTVISIICHEVLQVFKVDRVAIETFEQGSDYSEWTVSGEAKSGPDILGVKDIDYPAESKKYIGNRLLENNEDIVADDIEKSDLPEYFVNTHKKMQVKSLVSIPIKHRGDKIGVFVLAQVRNYRHWTQDEIELVHTIADQAYIAILQASLYSNAKDSAQRENFLRTISNEILTSDTLEDAVDDITDEIGRMFNVDRVLMRFFDPVDRSFSEAKGEFKKSADVPSAIDKRLYPSELNEYFLKEFGTDKNFIAVDDIDNPEYPELLRETLKKLDVKSTLVSAIKYKENLLAIIFLTNVNSSTKWKQKDIDLMIAINQQIAIGINLFQTTDKLSKSLNTERAIKDMILASRNLKTHDQIFNYLLEKVTGVFNTPRAVHIHYNGKCNLIVENEYLPGNELQPLIGQIILNADHTKEIVPKEAEDIIIINDVGMEINDSELREFLQNYGINAFLLYPKLSRYPEKIGETFLAGTMACSMHPRKWSANEIDSFKLIIDATSLVYYENLQRQEAEDIKNTFLATLTHDLRSPIYAEQKALEFILSRKPETRLDSFSEYLEDLYKTNEELLRIVNNILTLYHYESGNFALNLQPNNIKDIICDSIRSMKPLAKDQQSEITINIQDNLPEIMLDRDEIFRVITNLISNAIKHTRKGTSINVSAKKTDNNIEVSVGDNGQGIMPEERSKIFQRYPTAKRQIGTGLGLYLSKQIIDAHHGNIWFETEPGKGTTFYFTLPIAKE